MVEAAPKNAGSLQWPHVLVITWPVRRQTLQLIVVHYTRYDLTL